jgi:hypothetical protein
MVFTKFPLIRFRRLRSMPIASISGRGSDAWGAGRTPITSPRGSFGTPAKRARFVGHLPLPSCSGAFEEHGLFGQTWEVSQSNFYAAVREKNLRVGTMYTGQGRGRFGLSPSSGFYVRFVECSLTRNSRWSRPSWLHVEDVHKPSLDP